MNIFSEIQQGDSATWTDEALIINGVRFDSTGYALKYELRGPGAPLTINSTASGTGWSSTLSTVNSAALTPGKWWWGAFLTSTGVRVTAGQGDLTVTADLTQAGINFDGRSIAEVALAAAEGALASFSSSKGKIKKYQIGGRMMEFASVAEILEVISYWKAKVLTEMSAKNIANGLGDPRRLYVRFTK